MSTQNKQQSTILTIAIVGRPNVGKSTLYNRIIGQRVAIESSESSTTRDRLTNEFFWRGQTYFLVDTAGLISPTDEILTASIKATEIAIREADLILFVIDFKDGLTDPDMAIARKLRQGKKPIILVANKCDAGFNQPDTLEFKWAGFNNVSMVSAISGQRIGDLLDNIAQTVGKRIRNDSQPSNEAESVKPKPDSDAIPVAICGRPNVGKSTLVNQIIGQDRMIVSSIPHTTRDAQDIIFSHQGKKIRLIDTAGLSKKARTDWGSVESFAYGRSIKAIAECQIAIYVLSADEDITALDLSVISQAKKLGKSIIVAVNKSDLWDNPEKSSAQKTAMFQKKLSFIPYLSLVFISAQEKTNLKSLLDLVLKIANVRGATIDQAVIDQILKDAKLAQLSVQYFKSVKLEKNNPPVFKLVTHDNQKPHFSHLRYLENRIRETYPFPATPIFIDWADR